MVVVIPITFGLFALARRAMPLWRSGRLSRLNVVLQENLAGARVVKAFARERHGPRATERPTAPCTTSTCR